MDRIERVLSVIEGRRPDRPPVGFWHHFPADQVGGEAAVQSHIAHVARFDLDFLKIMNDHGYPHEGVIESVEDLASLGVLRGDEPAFAGQFELIALLKRIVGGEMLMTTTVFNAWATLRRLVRGPVMKHQPPNMDASEDTATAMLLGFYEADTQAVQRAIGTISTNLSQFARGCLEAGADGVFMSVRDDWLDGGPRGPGLYDALVRASDLEILDAASAGRFNMLHVCGKAVNFRAFAEYPVQVINWADRAAGPSIREACGWVKPAICAGVDNLSTLPEGTEADCEREVADALQQAGNRPILIGPGCTYDPDIVPLANLGAVCRAARG